MWLDIRDSLRAVVKRPALTAVIVATLALAIGANATIFSALNAVLLAPLDFADPDELLMLWERNADIGVEHEQVSAATYVDWRERSRTMEALAAYRYRGFTLTDGPQPVRVNSVDVSPALFDVLGVPPFMGRPLQASDERPGGARVAVISHAMWANRFGADSSILNTRILLDSEPYTVVGITPPSFRFPADDPTVELWTPLTLSLDALPSRPHRMYNVVGRLAAGFTIAQAREEMDAIADGIARENPESNSGWGVTIASLHDHITGGSRRTLWFLQGAVGLILLIGCVNVANLLLAKAITQSGDFAVRAAFGATGVELVRRSLVESLILAVLGGSAGLALAFTGVAVLRRVVPPDLPRAQTIGIDVTVLLFTVGATLAAGLAFGILPGARSARVNLSAALQEGGRRLSPGRRARWITNALVVTEVSLALVLLVGAGLMIRSFARLTRVDPGFRTEDVTAVAISLPQSRYAESSRQRQFFLDLTERVRRLPGLETTGAVSALPLSPVGTEFEMPFSRAGLETASPSERPRADYRAVLPGYFEAMGIPLLQGRLFDQFDNDNRPVAIINESLQRRYFADVNPIGQMLLRAPMVGDLEIVGVVGDVKHASLSSEGRPEMFVPFVQLPLSQMHVVTHTSDGASAATMIRSEVLAMDPELPVTAVASMSDLISVSVAGDRFNMLLLAGLAATAAVLAAVGIYGVVSYTVARRTGEIGLRAALGARERDTIWLVVRQSLSVVAAGILLGCLAAVASGRFIEGLLYSVAPTDPATYVTVSVVLVAVGIIAAAVPARRAAAIDPVDALRGQ